MNSRLPIYTPGQAAAGEPAEGSEHTCPGSVAVVNLGCPKNVVDSEVVLGLFAARGFQPAVSVGDAEVLVVNTCAFLESAVEESVDRILEIVELKTKGQCRSLIVTGCLVERYGAELSKELPEVDHFVALNALDRIVEEELQSFVGETGVGCVYDEAAPRVLSTPGHYAYVKIADGCNRPCAFCIIPRIRGRYQSRSIDSVAAEVQALLDIGVKELNLVAQDTTAFGSERADDESLVKLLSRIESNAANVALFWIRLLYGYPEGVSEELVRYIEKSKRVCSYIDLPLQHVSERVLKSMRRPLGPHSTRTLVESIKTWGPSVQLRTTFIAGFPGESEEDIAELEAFVSEGHFAHLGVFPYSPEPESAASGLADYLSAEEKKARCERILEAQSRVLDARLPRYIGQCCEVLVDGTHEDTDLLLVGRTEWQAPEVDSTVIINDADEELRGPEDGSLREQLFGRFVDVKITEVAGGDLVGKVFRIADY